MAEIALVALAIAATALWLVLHHWYGLRDNWHVQNFAFDKVRGGKGEPALTPELRWTGVIFFGLSLLYAIGYVVVAKLPRVRQSAKIAILLIGLGPGAVNIDIFPVGALDVFRYMRALKQYLYFHENPYIQGFTAHKNDPFAINPFLLNLPNAKGPSWLFLSAIPAWLGGFSDPLHMIVALKAENLLLIGFTAIVAARAFTDSRHRWLAGYAVWANPLMLFEGVANVHNDVMIAFFVVAALVMLKRDSWLALPLLTLSALVKYFTLQLGPLFLLAMIARRWPARRIGMAVLGAAVVVVACVLPFWAGGQMIHGIKNVDSAYTTSSHVSIISLVRQFRIRALTDAAKIRAVTQNTPFFAALFIALAEPVLWRARRGKHLEQTALDLTLLFLVLLTLLYPWYLITVVALLALRRNALNSAYLFVMTALALIYYPASVWAWWGGAFTSTTGFNRLHRHLYLSTYLMIPIFAYWLIRGGRWVWAHRYELRLHPALGGAARMAPTPTAPPRMGERLPAD